MAHFAKLDENNIVTAVYVVNNDVAVDEETGIAFVKQTNQDPDGIYLQTSYNTVRNQHRLGGTPFRGNYGGIGSKWLPDVELFQPPSPHDSWTWSNETASWEPPIPRPTEEPTPGSYWSWDEAAYVADTANPKTQGWVELAVSIG